jgi:hypothetical protein
MCNATEENRQDRPDTPEVRPNKGPCPRWCLEHEDADVGHQDEMLVHCGQVRRAGGHDVQLRQVQLVNRDEWDAVYVRVDDEFIPPMEAASDAAQLTAVLMQLVVEAR